jgi:hypothetical protein
LCDSRIKKKKKKIEMRRRKRKVPKKANATHDKVNEAERNVPAPVSNRERLVAIKGACVRWTRAKLVQKEQPLLRKLLLLWLCATVAVMVATLLDERLFESYLIMTRWLEICEVTNARHARAGYPPGDLGRLACLPRARYTSGAYPMPAKTMCDVFPTLFDKSMPLPWGERVEVCLLNELLAFRFVGSQIDWRGEQQRLNASAGIQRRHVGYNMMLSCERTVGYAWKLDAEQCRQIYETTQRLGAEDDRWHPRLAAALVLIKFFEYSLIALPFAIFIAVPSLSFLRHIVAEQIIVYWQQAGQASS